MLGWRKSSTLKVLKDKGKTVTSPKEIAQLINKEQILKNIRLHRSIPATNLDPLTNYKKLMGDKTTKFKLNTITMLDMRKILNTRKSTNSTGWDTISIKTLKTIQKPIEQVLLNIINTSISTQNYPDNLKHSKAIPLLKSGKPTDTPSSYRLINILPSISKLLDKVTSTQILPVPE